MLNACRSNPVATCLAAFALAILFSWRQFLLGHHSPFTGDIRHYHHPITRAAVHAFSDGRLPLWSDATYFGFPLLVDPQLAVWYPATALVAWLGPHHGYIVFLVLHGLLAAAGMLGLMRSHGVGWSAAWVAGLFVSLSGYFAHEAQHPGLLAILCWFPLFLWAGHAVFERPTPGRIAAAALSGAMMIFAGTLQVLFGAMILYLFYGIGQLFLAAQERGWPETLRASCFVILAQLLGLALVAVVLVPAVLHLPETARSLGMTYEFAAMGSVSLIEMLGMFVNGVALHSQVGPEPLDLGISYYLGSLSLVLAIVGLFATEQRRFAIWLAVGVAFLLLIAMGRHSGLHSLLYEAYPHIVGGLRGVGRALGSAAVGFALLAGLGLHALRDPTPFQQKLVLGLLAAGVAAYAISFFVVPDFSSVDSIGSALVLMAALGIACVPFFAGRVSESRVLEQLRLLGQREDDADFAGFLRRGFVVLVVLDLVAFGTLDSVLAANPAPPVAEGTPDALAELDDVFAGKFGHPGARLMLHGFGPLNLPLLQQIDGVGGYNPLVMLQYLDFVSLINTAKLFPRKPIDKFVSGAKPQRFQSALFDATAIRYVVSTRPDAVGDLRFVGRYTGSLLGEMGAGLYENESALPRAYLAYRTRYAEGESELERLLGPRFDGRNATVVEGTGPKLEGPALITPVERTGTRPEVRRFEVSPERQAILVVVDTWYPGWRAWVDGIESPVFRVNGMFRGVAIPVAAQRVEMRFEPWTFRVGSAISLAALVVIAVLVFMSVTSVMGRARADRTEESPHGI